MKRLVPVVKLTCPLCKEAVEVPGAEVLLINYETRSTCSFTCPECGELAARPVDTAEMRLLKAGGITARMIPAPKIGGLIPSGPPINEDDLIALGLELQRLP